LIGPWDRKDKEIYCRPVGTAAAFGTATAGTTMLTSAARSGPLAKSIDPKILWGNDNVLPGRAISKVGKERC